MQFNKSVYTVIVLGCFIITGCAKTTQITELSSDIQDINNKVNQINEQIDSLRDELNQNKNETARANKRLDNQISIFHK